MKAAMWGVGLIVLGMLAIVLFNLFGNITVTNQFNYTTMKNAVQSAMNDSLDLAHYRAGFCLCTTDGSTMNLDSVKIFNNKSEYKLLDVVDDKCGEENNNSCIILYGQYRLDKDKFTKLFDERFRSLIINNKEYNLEVLDVIEYPPKVSVRVTSSDEEFSPTDKESGGYDIVNVWDAIIETDNNMTIVIPSGNDDNDIEYTCNPPLMIDEDNSDSNDENENSSNNSGDKSNCKWHYRFTFVDCPGSTKSNVGICRKSSANIYTKSERNSALIAANSKAKGECQSSCLGAEITGVNDFKFLQYYDVYDSKTKRKLCSKKEASSPSEAKSSCGLCSGKSCYATCVN